MEKSSASPPPNDASSPGTAGPSSSAIVEAIERRLRQQQQVSPGPTQANPNLYSSFDEHHEKRQEFRRLIDPNILRPNPRPIALEALNILARLAENILKDPTNETYHRFKPTNSKIKTYLVDAKGTLEFARALGFEPQVDNFQPYYVFNKRKMMDLRIGAAIIQEIVQQERSKEGTKLRALQQEKAAAEAVVMKAKQAFLDDRKSAANRAERERELRAAKASAGTPTAPTVRSTTQRRSRKGEDSMPGTGQKLSGETAEPKAAPSDVKSANEGTDNEDDEDDEGDDDSD